MEEKEIQTTFEEENAFLQASKEDDNVEMILENVEQDEELEVKEEKEEK